MLVPDVTLREGTICPILPKNIPFKLAVIVPNTFTMLGIREVSKAVKNMKIIYETLSGLEAIFHLKSLPVDGILLDETMPEVRDIILHIKSECPHMKLIIMPEDNPLRSIEDLLSTNGDAYCMKQTIVKPGYMHQIIEAIQADEAWIGPQITKNFLRYMQQKSQSPPLTFNKLHLNGREKEILTLVAQGKNNDDIARSLNLSYHTIKAALTTIFQKLGVQDRTQAAIKVLTEIKAAD